MHAERRMRKGSMGLKGRLKAESGTCNVCSAPCSSCMHHNLGYLGSNSDESSDETCHGPVASQCSVNEDAVLPSSRVKAHSGLNYTASEASNLVSVNSNHDAFSENAESRAVVRSSDASDDSDDVGMRGKISSAGIGLENQVTPDPNGNLNQSNVLNKEGGSKHVEGLKGKILRVSRVNSFDVELNNHNKNRTDVSHGSAIVSDPGSDGSSKVQIVRKLDSSDVLPNEAELVGVHGSHRSDNSPTCGDFNQKSGAESSKASEHSSDELFQYSGQDDNDKSGKKVRTHETQEPKSPTISEHESDDTELIEHDVKVCDICGDAGREDLLAICSRCSDGAEHTYCMREMLQEVPEGEWLCEECKFAVEAERQKQVSDAKGKRENKVHSVAQSSGKRHAENPEAAPVAKRQAIDISIGSPKAAISRTDALSRELSFKGTEKVNRKPAHQASLDNHHDDIVEIMRSTGSQLQSSKGTLFKSKSFNATNSKPKVKLVDDIVLPRQKGAKEYTSIDVKERSSRTISKSMSFKSTDVGSSYGIDSKVKSVPSKSSHPPEVLGSKQAKERGRFEKKDLSKSDCSVVCSKTASSTVSTSKVDQRLTRVNSASISNANNSRELRGLQTDGKSSSLTKQASSLTRNRIEVPVTFAKAPSTHKICGSTEQNSNQSNTKDEHSSTSSESAEGLPGHSNGISQDVLSQLRESRNLGENSMEAVVNRSRPSLFSGSKGPPSQKDGDTAEQSSIDAPSFSDCGLSTTRNFREEMNKGNRLRAAVDAALRKKPNFGKNRGMDQSDGSSVSNAELSCDKSFQSQLPVSNMGKNSISVDVMQRGQPNFLTASDSFKQTLATNGKHLAFPSTDAKPILREWPLTAITVLSKTSAIPEHECIWQGGLEVLRGGSLPELHNGIQVHLSSLASSKVREVVHKFPERIPLNEVQRLTLWPAQFHENGAKEDHIALFFFAKDIESYEKNYRPLVNSMMKKDLALKGSLDGVELLIFASNQLPQNCRRWNMLFFLWGVFRGRRESFSNLPKITCMSGLNVSPQDRGFTNILPQNPSFLKHLEKESAVCESPCNATAASEALGKTLLNADEDKNNRDSLTELSSMGSEANSRHPRFLSKLVSSDARACPKQVEYSLQEHELDRKPTPLQAVGLSCGPNNGMKTSSFASGDSPSRNVQPIENQETGARSRVNDEKMQVGEDPATFVRNSEVCTTQQESTLERHPSCDEANHRKRPYLDLTETENSSDKKDKLPWTDLNTVFADIGSVNKKVRTGSGGENVRMVSGNTSTKDSVPSENRNLDLSSSTIRSVPKSLNQSERYIFPVDLNHGCDEQQLHGAVPDLGLAVQTEILPLFAGRADGCDGQGKADEEKEEDIAASLSLSLAFPFPDKERSVKPVSKKVPDRQDVSTSLLLFRGLADK